MLLESLLEHVNRDHPLSCDWVTDSLLEECVRGELAGFLNQRIVRHIRDCEKCQKREDITRSLVAAPKSYESPPIAA